MSNISSLSWRAGYSLRRCALLSIGRDEVLDLEATEAARLYVEVADSLVVFFARALDKGLDVFQRALRLSERAVSLLVGKGDNALVHLSRQAV